MKFFLKFFFWTIPVCLIHLFASYGALAQLLISISCKGISVKSVLWSIPIGAILNIRKRLQDIWQL